MLAAFPESEHPRLKQPSVDPGPRRTSASKAGYQLVGGRDTCHFVGDVKYKRLRAPGLQHGDLHQLLAYLTATDLPEGFLIYAAGEAQRAFVRLILGLAPHPADGDSTLLFVAVSSGRRRGGREASPQSASGVTPLDYMFRTHRTT